MGNWKNKLPKENIVFETTNGVLYKCDCFELIKKIPNEIVNMVITSPPYLKLQKYNHLIDWINNESLYI